ncbi:cation-translocating P-type ATPase [Paenibacillus sedimenti]|uniref:Cation-translocating P-type ATPase n=1 Tax=Paenibacillus sedimenti TaxID=2770274 RepID=A0A926KUF9_9BACL|nr:HAD-IC family P-type ATPase [Paenibacillus sedimenti]MBD0384240.1 cation-translocating P-type ATPase [Paenibacillus sedimenti]
MSSSRNKDRFVRVLPGRIRMEICGLQGNKQTAELLVQTFRACKGIYKAEPCLLTGRLLLLYDEMRMTSQDIFGMIRKIEEQVIIQNAPVHACDKGVSVREEVKQEVAAASDVDLELPDDIRVLPQLPNPDMKKSAEKIPLPLALSMGGLAVLGAKQLFMGRSALARSPAPFYLSALVSVVTGYPFLKRGIQNFSEKKQLNSDLILGTSALALALVRENLVVLAGLSILQYVNWKRSHSVLKGQQDISLSPDIQAYSEKAGKIGIVAAGVTWAVTRNPLRAIAVLLAANPRPMTIPAKCAWNQAELVSDERHYAIPAKGSLSQLARTKTILIEDSSLLFDPPEIEEIECMTSNEEDADKIVCYAASLMAKSSHPWKEDIWNKAKQTCRTIRTAFHVEEEEQGIIGKINDNRVMLGSFKYLQEHGIDCTPYELKAKRLLKKGSTVLFVGKHGAKGGECLGLLVRHQETAMNEHGLTAASFIEKGWRVQLLHNSLQISNDLLLKHDMDISWLLLEQGEVIEKIAVMQQHGEEVLFVASTESTPVNSFFKEAGLPSISVDELKSIQESAEYAGIIDQTVNEHASVTKKWNLLGSALATFGMISAPVVNLAADALSLVFMSRSKKISEAFPPASANMYHPEIAAASEAPVWHALSCEQVTGKFHVKERLGLTSDQVISLRNRYGANRLDIKKGTPWLISYLGQFKEFTTLILLGTSVLALFTGGVFDGVAMGAILLANAAIGTIQERKAEKVVETLNQFQPPACKTIRDGEQAEMSAAELVPGDIVCLEAGDRVPADIRLINSWNMRVNEAALTGESLPVEKNESPLAEHCSLSEQRNMLFMGTDVCGGKGIGIVVRTGMQTEMGHLMSLIKNHEKEVTPLQAKVTSISKKFVKGALVAGGLVFLTGLLRGIPITQMITTSITLAASAIPEGLPVTITIALSAGIFRMAKKNALIRKLSSLETLGRTTIICTDKTGTLTKNEMTVKALATVNRSWTINGEGYEPIGSFEEVIPEVAAASANLPRTQDQHNIGDDPDLKRIFQICLLCNNSKLEQENERWITKGDPTEGALLSLAAKTGLWEKDMSHWHRGLEIPFDSGTAKMSVVCKDSQSEQECYVFSKGAVETILRHSNRYQKNGEIYPLSEEHKQLILQQNDKLSSDALRVLAFAYRKIDEHANEEGMDEKELIYVGMAGMMDPPKPEVEHNIREALELGVKPVMITGDHPITAIAIAKQLGIYTGSENVLTGHELERISDDELVRIVDQISIFARVTPEHKLRIVTAFQKRGHIVAMTGDGVNDTPAIKQANVGIAMGRTGTEVTKETADMVLTEDHFGTIVEGVKEGRTIIGNIRKALGCLLTGNLAEIIVTSAAVMVGLPIPLVPIQILLMNLLTDALPAMILAVNPGNKTKQTKRTDIVDKELYRKVITRGVLLGLGSIGLFAASIAAGAPVPVAQSMAFATLVAGQLIQTFSWRQEGSEETIRDWTKDRFLLGALGISWLALLAALYVPPLAGFFHTAPLSIGHWVPILGVAGSVSLLSKPVLSLISRTKEHKLQPSMGEYVSAAA